MTQLQVMFTLTDKPIFSLNPKELKEHQLNKELFGDLPDNEYDKLKKDIAERGIQDPLHVVKQKDKWLVVSGHQRKKIAEELKINVPCINRTDLKKDWQIEEQLIADNLFRRHLKDWQLTPIFEKRLEIEKTKAKQRQKEHGETAPGKPKNTGGKISTSDKGKSRDKAAEGLGRSGRQLEKISKVYHEAPEDIKKQWKNDEITTHTAYKKLKREKVIEEQKAKLKIKPMPTGKYGVIYADCPWKYEFTKTKNREIENKYPTMTLSELKNMILPEVEEDAVLYLWATAPKLLEALEVMKTWGFKYKTHAIWDKQKIGMGILVSRTT